EVIAEETRESDPRDCDVVRIAIIGVVVARKIDEAVEVADSGGANRTWHRTWCAGYRRDTSAGVGTSRSQEVVVLALVGGLTQQFQVVLTEEFAVVLGAKRD